MLTDWDSLNLPFARPAHKQNAGDSSSDIVFQLIGAPQTSTSFHNGSAVLSVYWFGTTADGSLVRVRSTSKLPNMCSNVPAWINNLLAPEQADELHRMLEDLRESLNERLAIADHKLHPSFIENISVVYRKPLFYYAKDAQPMLFYELNVPQGVKLLRDELVEGRATDQFGNVMPTQVYNADIDFTWRCMIDQHLTMCNYMRLAAGTYTSVAAVARAAVGISNERSRSNYNSAAPASRFTDERKQAMVSMREDTNTLEVECTLSSMLPVACEGVFERHAPMRLFGIDIECENRPGVFPQAEHDRILCICCSVHILGEAEKLGSDALARARSEYLATHPNKTKLSIKRQKKLRKIANEAAFQEGFYVAFHIGDIDATHLPTDKSGHAQSYDTEVDMLLGFASFFRWLRPEITISWNGHNFDIPYIIDRASALGVGVEFCSSGVPSLPWTKRKSTFKNKAYGARDGFEIRYPGCTFLDAMQVDMRGQKKRRRYTLDAVAKEVLGVGKVDLHYTEITPKYLHGGPAGRGEVVRYCLTDQERAVQIAYACQQVMENLELARVTGCSVDTLLTRGVSAKSYLYIARKAAQRDCVIDYYRRNDDAVDDGVGFSGAIVIEPVIGLYKIILTLDFASLYPSIIQAFNYCYSTELHPEDLHLFSLEQYERTEAEGGSYFVSKDVQEGLLPEIERELVAARGVSKRKMAQYEKDGDFAMADAMNNRQLGEKLVGNGVYGFTGSRYKLPNLSVSESVTKKGQQLIMEARTEALRLLHSGATPFGTFPNAKVVYGDTDSLMVWLGDDFDNVDLGFEIGRWLAAEITKRFPKPVKLEFEKVYSNYLLARKKRYAALKHMEPGKPGEPEAKGIDSKRRDNSPWHARVIETVVNTIVTTGKVDGVVDYCRDQVRALYAHEISIEDLTITTQYGKDAQNYKSLKTKSGKAKAKPAHLIVNEEIKRKEGEGAAFHMGDRVPFCIVPGAPGSKKSERARYSKYVQQSGGYVDIPWYLDTLKSGLDRLLGALKGPDFVQTMIMTGAHTLKRKSTATQAHVDALWGLDKKPALAADADANAMDVDNQ